LNIRIDLGGKDPNLEVGRLRFKNEISSLFLKKKKKINFFLLENRGVVTLKNKNGEREGRTLCDLLIFEREHTSIKKKTMRETQREISRKGN